VLASVIMEGRRNHGSRLNRDLVIQRLSASQSLLSVELAKSDQLYLLSASRVSSILWILPLAETDHDELTDGHEATRSLH